MKMNFKYDKECVRNMEQEDPEGRCVSTNASLFIAFAMKCYIMEPRPGRSDLNKFLLYYCQIFSSQELNN